MPMYRISWEIDAIEADTPQEAAQIALEIQRDPSSDATFFDVTDMDGNGTVHNIDVAGEMV